MDIPFRLDGRRAAVTGGASGIGEATCRVLAAAGALVTIVDIDVPRAKSLADEIPGSSILECDITDAEAVNAAFASLSG
jgi:2-keto-3-deoxy-L-fuconate dehydrogenase